MNNTEKIRWGRCLLAFCSSAFQAFGMYHIHSVADVTEGGVLGATLLVQHWLNISPAISGFVLNALCYVFGWKTLGRPFLIYSIVASAGFSLGYGLWEQFPLLWPRIGQFPLAAALVGAVFIGLGAGFCIRSGGATCGDDALAMSLSRLWKVEIQWIYLASDLLILLLSVSYIPLRRILYSLVTVVLSGQIIGWIQKIPAKKQK